MTRALLLALLMLSVPARAHQAYDWIMKPQYVNRGGIHCCSNEHCVPVVPGEMERIPGGWLHKPTNTTLMDSERGVYPSEDMTMYRCLWGGKLQCVFWTAGF